MLTFSRDDTGEGLCIQLWKVRLQCLTPKKFCHRCMAARWLNNQACKTYFPGCSDRQHSANSKTHLCPLPGCALRSTGKIQPPDPLVTAPQHSKGQPAVPRESQLTCGEPLTEAGGRKPGQLNTINWLHPTSKRVGSCSLADKTLHSVHHCQQICFPSIKIRFLELSFDKHSFALQREAVDPRWFLADPFPPPSPSPQILFDF